MIHLPRFLRLRERRASRRWERTVCARPTRAELEAVRARLRERDGRDVLHDGEWFRGELLGWRDTPEGRVMNVRRWNGDMTLRWQGEVPAKCVRQREEGQG